MIIEHVIGKGRMSVKANRTCEPVYARMSHQKLAHFWKVEFVGKAMLARFMASWYRTSNFEMLSYPTHIRRFLSEEAPCLNLPRYRLITNVSIHVRPDMLALDPKEGGQPWLRHALPATWKRLIQDFESLFQLRSGASIHILLNHSGRYAVRKECRKTLFTNGIAPMFGSLRRLRNAGYIVGASVVVFGQYLRLEDSFEGKCSPCIL